MKIKYILLIGILLISINPIKAQLLLNEISNTNNSFITSSDEDDNDDWIEIYNAGSAAVNLLNYGLSDRPNEPDKWLFPEIIIQPYSHLIVIASGKDERSAPVNHWETVIYRTDFWKYKVGDSEPPSNWIDLNFDDSTWPMGKGGFGYGSQDTCINTFVPPGSYSVFVRKKFNIYDVNKISQAVLHLDFDDGFVAYLNGVEVGRKNMKDNRPAYNAMATDFNDPILYQGKIPEANFVDEAKINNLLINGENVLCIQVHNISPFSSDLSCNPYLTLGIADSTNHYGAPPSWLNLKSSYLNADFKLSTGEELVLSNPQGAIIDSYVLGDLQLDQSFGRSPDGGSQWCIFSSPTPGYTNYGTCYSGYISAPVFSVAPGFYPGAVQVTLISEPDAEIHYTINGNIPKQSDPVYSQPININNTQVLSAKAFAASGKLPSKLVKGTYFINENIDVAVFSVSTDSTNLWDYNTGIYVDGPNASPDFPFFGANFWQKWEKPAYFEYFDKSGDRKAFLEAGLRIHGGYSRGFPQKSFRMHARKMYGTSRLNYPVIPDKPEIINYKRLILRNGGQDYYRSRFRDGMLHRLMKNTHSDYMAYDPAVVFLNGKYWGLYGVRERQDKHYLQSNYDVPDDELDLLEHKGFLRIIEGSDTGFYAMHDMIVNASSSATDFYENATKRLDTENFADYFISQTFYANKDWMGDATGNIKLWRPHKADGRWRYILLDLDFCLGARSNSFPYDNMLKLARNPNDGNHHSRILDKMLKNEQFRNYFINRYADLINTVFHANSINSMAMKFKMEIETSMPRHGQRWTTSVTTWHNSIQSMLDFAAERIPYARQHIQDEFDLPKQVEVTLNVVPENAAQIKISTIVPDSLPWKGIYFDGVPVSLSVIPAPFYEFLHWGSNSLLPSNNPDPEIKLIISNNETFTAYFQPSGIRKNNTDFQVYTFPNPSAGDITVHIYGVEMNQEKFSMAIFDLAGREIKQINKVSSDRVVLKREEFSNGIYMVRVTGDNGSIVKKLIFR
jgi:hypothetical protein